MHQTCSAVPRTTPPYLIDSGTSVCGAAVTSVEANTDSSATARENPHVNAIGPAVQSVAEMALELCYGC
jgi:hypothetical protein